MPPSTAIRPTYYPFRGDPPSIGLPQAVWHANGRVTGDATGGNQTVVVQFSDVLAALSGLMFSLEEILLISSSGTTTIVTATISGFYANEIRENQALGFAVDMRNNGTSGGARINLSDTRPRLFLGKQSADNPIVYAAHVQFEYPNTNLTNFFVHASGYQWGPGAMNSPGGPQKPANGLFL